MEAFLAQADAGKDLRTSSYPSEYRGLQIKVSFGQGAFSKIPWIAFLTGEQQVSNGIYPVLLYYRDARVLILAYGVSETNQPVNSWRDLMTRRLLPNSSAKSLIESRSVMVPHMSIRPSIFQTDLTLNC